MEMERQGHLVHGSSLTKWCLVALQNDPLCASSLVDDLLPTAISISPRTLFLAARLPFEEAKTEAEMPEKVTF